MILRCPRCGRISEDDPDATPEETRGFADDICNVCDLEENP